MSAKYINFPGKDVIVLKIGTGGNIELYVKGHLICDTPLDYYNFKDALFYISKLATWKDFHETLEYRINKKYDPENHSIIDHPFYGRCLKQDSKTSTLEIKSVQKDNKPFIQVKINDKKIHFSKFELHQFAISLNQVARDHRKAFTSQNSMDEKNYYIEQIELYNG